MSSEKIAHLYYAINGLGTAAALDLVTKDFVGERLAFIYVGSISRAKASHTLVRAFLQVASDVEQVALVMVGAGSLLPRCQHMTEQARAENKILFRGVVPMHQMGSVLGCGRVLVQPSMYDGWGVVLNEGASSGLALIASDRVGAAYHLIEPGRNGFRVRGASTVSLADAMRHYASHPGLAEEHGARSLELFQKFTPAASAARFTTAIRSWLAGAPQWSEFYKEWSAVERLTARVDTAA
jgi:glycosyltransferase involved in cell wall biosynthesis